MEIGFLVEKCEKMMKMMSEADIKMGDWRYVKLYQEFCEGEKNGKKMSYVVYELSQRYGISEASVWRVLRRFRREVGMRGEG